MKLLSLKNSPSRVWGGGGGGEKWLYYSPSPARRKCTHRYSQEVLQQVLRSETGLPKQHVHNASLVSAVLHLACLKLADRLE